MSRKVRVASFAFLAVLLPATAHAQSKPDMTWVPADPGNYGGTSGRTIEMIVIHKAEGSLDMTTSWFANPAAGVSAHYCVDDSEIAQMVEDKYVAWHCGNGAYNKKSIGIENSGFTYRDDFTDAHYHKLAKLVAWLCSSYAIPADRDHVIGHSEVPDPNHPGEFGGAHHHTDPGPYFSWDTLMKYVGDEMGSSASSSGSGPSSSAGSSSSSLSAVSVSTASLNVRDGAWGTIIGHAPSGSAWVETGNEDSGFVEVWFRGGTGWIYASLTAGYSGDGATVTAAKLNVRASASGSATIVGHVSSGQSYASAGASADGLWLTIRFDESRRWVYKSYTSAVSLSP